MTRSSSSDSNSSSSSSFTSSDNKYKRPRSSRKDALPKKNILFISHLNPQDQPYILADKLRQLFSPKCTIQSLNVKTTQNGMFKFAFLELKQTTKIQKIIDQMNGKMLDGSRILVERQKSKRTDVNHRNIISLRNGGNCYRCNRPGHFARECPKEYGYRTKERRKSASRSRDRSKKKRSYPSSSSSSSSDSHSYESRQKRYKSHKKAKKHRYQPESTKSDRNHRIRL